jgi:transposase
MLAVGVSIENIAISIGCCERTILNWVEIYLTKGVDALNSFNYQPKQAYLNFNQINQVVIYVSFEYPENIKKVVSYIEEKFGVSYSDEAVRKMLEKQGLKYIRTKMVPGSTPSVETQEQFIKKFFELDAQPDIKVLFVDAMHLHHQNLPTSHWGDPLFPSVHETNSGRKRINILGAYDVDNHSLVHVTGEQNCDADRVVELFGKIDKAYSDYSSITLILDNAKYFHAKKVEEWLEENKRINLEFLPPYAPNLNLIERLWRLAKKYLVRGKYYKEYKKFRARVFQFLNNLGDHFDELNKLIPKKFEIVYA